MENEGNGGDGDGFDGMRDSQERGRRLSALSLGQDVEAVNLVDAIHMSLVGGLFVGCEACAWGGNQKPLHFSRFLPQLQPAALVDFVHPCHR